MKKNNEIKKIKIPIMNGYREYRDIFIQKELMPFLNSLFISGWDDYFGIDVTSQYIIIKECKGYQPKIFFRTKKGNEMVFTQEKIDMVNECVAKFIKEQKRIDDYKSESQNLKEMTAPFFKELSEKYKSFKVCITGDRVNVLIRIEFHNQNKVMISDYSLVAHCELNRKGDISEPIIHEFFGSITTIDNAKKFIEKFGTASFLCSDMANVVKEEMPAEIKQKFFI